MLSLRFLYIIILSSVALASQAQFPSIDIVREKAGRASTPKAELDAIMELVPFRNSLNADTVNRYFSRAKELALRLNDRKQMRWAEYMLLSGELTKGGTDSVLLKLRSNALLQFEKGEDQELYYKVRLLEANVLNRTNDRAKALDLQLALYEEAEKDNDLLAQSYLLNYIGASYLNSGQTEQARSSWFEALRLAEPAADNKFREIQITLYSNLALFYFQQISTDSSGKKADSFQLYNNKVIQESRYHNVYWLLPVALSYRGEYSGYKGMRKEGEADFKEAIEIRRKIGDPLYTINDLFRMAGFYSFLKEYDSAIEVLQEAMKVIKEAHINEALLRVSGLLSYVYKQKGDYKSYSTALEQFILDADTAMRLNAADKINEITTRYDLQKKETVIARQKLELAERTIYLVGAFFLLALAITVFYFYFKGYKRKQKLQSAAAVAEAENKERRRISAELHDNMGVHANAILHNTSLLGTDYVRNEQLIHNLQDTAKEMLGSLRETVWALKSADVTCAETWLRLVNFIQQSKRNFQDIHFEISGTPPEGITITSVRALHIIMVVKEAVANAIKHGGAGSIAVTGQYTNSWLIAVTDNGKGFDVDKQQSGSESNGLLNMKDRAEAGGFTVALSSKPGEGTLISLQIPV